ncbi:lipoyl(octanoyl) transferase LipB [Mucilaginibacter sp. cycad4]|uniref:lipoyl(octanoyl) transferase LipB n=1 Tax=Mucilaginibacter sp. cycad4 TaxID=3342096 RepID=UPI002AAB156F|nr:lipoyl(octanoyl) transferase LipB [Mucilaginibacter gossypii]WPU99138.1 lipoyl(octanoyl) transferase LipB [Mucilaginibacter gossypii]
MKNKTVELQDWGLIDFKSAWDKQEEIFEKTIRHKIDMRQLELSATNDPEIAKQNIQTSNYLVFCEHPNVYTLGKSGKVNNLLLDEEGLHARNARYYHINRGGDVTFHGPGQLLCYPILDLDNFFTDIHLYLRTLEEAVINTLSDFGLSAGRYPGFTGIWFDADNGNARKIAAMGVRCSRWVTMHGLSLNVNTDLTYYNDIVACGISDKATTSMEAELGHRANIQDVQSSLTRHISTLFDMTIS